MVAQLPTYGTKLSCLVGKVPVKILVSGWLAAAILACLPVASTAAHGSPVELGVLTPFYRSTQLQGHLFGMGLKDIPDYLLAEDVDLKYHKKSGMKKEIPFVDSFTINRFLGGYREDWLKKFDLWDNRLGSRSLDYAIRKSDGSLEFRPDLIRRRLAPYLDAGYRPSDITIALENVPWDLARTGNSAGAEGPWGQKEPPANMGEWAATIAHFASDLKAYLGPAATTMGFETGVEYSSRASFDGTAADFFNYYLATDRGLHSVLPGAAMSPGEFIGVGTCSPRQAGCVYDTRQLLDFAQANNLAVSDVPRSLYSLADQGDPRPSAVVSKTETSYARLPNVVAEVHQFGLLFEPFGREDGADTAALQANWQFQALIGLWERVKPRRVFHWGGFESVAKLEFLNGAGFLRLVLDHYLGYRALRLDVNDDGGGAMTVMAVGFFNAKSSGLIMSSFGVEPGAAARTVTVDLPDAVLGSRMALKGIRFSDSDNVYLLIRRDLANDDNLKPVFAACALCVGNPIAMAVNADRARQMLVRNWPSYVAEMKKSLRWSPNPPGVSLDGRRLRAQLEADEMLVLEPI